MMLLCSHVPTAKAFYIRHLGLEVTADVGWFVGLVGPEQPGRTFELSLCAADHSSVPPPLRSPTQGLILAFEVDDVHASCLQMKAQGVTILAEPVDERWGQRHFFAAAPDGVALDIFQTIAVDPVWDNQQRA